MSLPRGSLLRRTPSQLSILSYNLLAPLYVRPIDERTGKVQAFAAFPWAEPFDEVLAWDVRRPQLLSELVAAQADVVCLQEVQFEQQRGETGFALPEWLHLDGYQHVIPAQDQLEQMAQRNERVLRSKTAIGNALLYRSDRLEEVDACASSAGASAGRGKKGSSSSAKAPTDATTRVGVCVRGRAGSPLSDLGRLAIFAVHLDATREETRVKQLSKCLEMAREAYDTRSVIIAGDLNTEMLAGSCVSAMLTSTSPPSTEDLRRECASALRLVPNETADGDEGESSGAGTAAEGSMVEGPTLEQMSEWQKLYEHARGVPIQQRLRLERVPTGKTRAAYAHGASSPPCEAWSLDHILYSRRGLSLEAYWQTLEAEPAAAAAGLPCRGCPSDHLPVAASFEITPIPTLPAAEVQALLDRVEELLTKQQTERAELDSVLKGELSALEAAERLAVAASLPETAAGEGEAAGGAAAEAAAGSRASNKKAKKAKAGPPSVEMQALLRSKRERERACKAEQRLQRVSLVEACSELELDALEEAGTMERLEPLTADQGR